MLTLAAVAAALQSPAGGGAGSQAGGQQVPLVEPDPL